MIAGFVLFISLLAQPTNSPETVVEHADDIAVQIGKELRCPVCQGMPIAESPSQMARDMMVQVRQMVAQGQNKEQIDQFFVDRYGEWVLLKPSTSGPGVWVWILPVLMILLGLVFVQIYLRKTKKEIPSTSKPQEAADPYLDAVRREVEK